MLNYLLVNFFCFNVAASIKMRKFPSLCVARGAKIWRFNVAASIKMRKLWAARQQVDEVACFNVAASIKMRKFLERLDAFIDLFRASMWPHL